MSIFNLFKRKKNDEFNEYVTIKPKNKIVIPRGEHAAPTYILQGLNNRGSLKENHPGVGYHIHIYKLCNGGYQRTDAALTYGSNSMIYFFNHGEGHTNARFGGVSNKKIKDIKFQMISNKNKIFNVANNEWKPIEKKMIPLFRI